MPLQPLIRLLSLIYHERITTSPALPQAPHADGFRSRQQGFRLAPLQTFYRYASDALDHGLQYAYRDRKTKKRNYRALWQVRINAAAREAGMTYSRFMEGLKAAKCALDRKVLADMAAKDSAAFTELVQMSQNALKAKSAKTPTAA